jgi:hypothetical protein
MDPATVAAGVVALLSSFLVEGGKAVVKKAGEALWAALERRFKGKPASEKALADLKSEPTNPDNQVALRKELGKELAVDAEFLAQMAKLLEEAQAERATTSYEAAQQGAGAIAQGPGAAAAAAHGVAVAGDVKGDIRTVSREEEE